MSKYYFLFKAIARSATGVIENLFLRYKLGKKVLDCCLFVLLIVQTRTLIFRLYKSVSVQESHGQTWSPVTFTVSGDLAPLNVVPSENVPQIKKINRVTFLQ